MAKRIWLRGPSCVIGVDITWLNKRIDEFNSNPQLAEIGTFWDWLSWMEDETFYGISYHTEDTSAIHKIRQIKKQEINMTK